MIIGDRGRDAVVNLHQLYSKTAPGKKVLWCYKKELGFSSHKKRRMKQIKKLKNSGVYDTDVDDPFELFINSTDISYVFYKDSHRVLGNTFSMVVLQDFESITPNVLCRTIETVEGGGLVVLLLNTMSSLKQLYTLTMDCHQRYRTEAYSNVVPRFNERFILSLTKNDGCMVVDDEFNVLPISSKIKDMTAIEDDGEHETKDQRELVALKDSMKAVKPIGPLVSCSRTLDQATTVMSLVDTISEKNPKITVSVTAGRGRGKSATMGLAISAAVAYGLSNIVVTAPSPENLGTLFEFILKGLKALKYTEHQDFEIYSTKESDSQVQCVTRIDIYRDHRQSIQYIAPQDFNRVIVPELLVIDEAAAIPLPIVKHMLGNYLIFMSSTVNGYEGTGRSLSLKLIEQLRTQNRMRYGGHETKSGSQYRELKELKLEEPIRYGSSDPIEKWLNEILCLDCTEAEPLKAGAPHPNDCELYFVNRDTLFSYHKGSEKFLHKLMGLFVSSHYKNTPNDLQLLSDAPAHGIFVLCGPLNGQTGVPDILCAVQVCYEGDISKSSFENNLKRGFRPSGDLIPWTVSEQF